jgi:hypothetical protein
MKKILFVVLLAVTSLAAYAQPRAIGVNLGPWSSLSYQHGFGEKNMLDVAANVILPFRGTDCIGVGGHVTYDWIDPFNAPVPWNNKGEWHWYMGVGGSGGFLFPSIDGSGTNPGGWYAGVAGHIGIEYDFWFPLQLSLDWRPSFGYYSAANNFNIPGLYGGSIGVRYKF